MDRSRVSDIEEIGGEGVMAMVDGRACGCWQRQADAPAWVWIAPECRSVGTIIHMAVDGSICRAIS